ncbi:MAG: hypothetical protein ACP5N1_06265 [Candidatus Woesearchaeota archaeon]
MKHKKIISNNYLMIIIITVAIIAILVMIFATINSSRNDNAGYATGYAFNIMEKNITNTTLTTNIVCTDSDEGDNAYVKGNIRVTDDILGVTAYEEDICYDSNNNKYTEICVGNACQVFERYCIDTDNDNLKDNYNSHYNLCVNGCSNGACIN